MIQCRQLKGSKPQQPTQTNNITTRKGEHTMKTIYELHPINGRKSFYGKAEVIEKENGDIELKSYQTIVARIRNGKFERLWSGYSMTTMAHINSFINLFGISGGGKAWWDGLEVKAY